MWPEHGPGQVQASAAAQPQRTPGGPTRTPGVPLSGSQPRSSGSHGQTLGGSDQKRFGGTSGGDLMKVGRFFDRVSSVNMKNQCDEYGSILCVAW